MANGQLDHVIQHIRKLVGSDGAEELSDRELLERFTQEREGVYFEALVGRHGPLVLGVCQRVLNHDQDAEDAFQATFLVLARKAGSIRKLESVGSWLYGVAYRLALKVRASAARRRLRERQVAAMPQIEPAEEAGWQELRPVLDEELHRLPEKYRAPLLLCYIEGKTNVEAARMLGWPAGSISKRLARARNLLRARLVHRGVQLSTAVLATLLAEKTRAALPAALMQSTTKAALLVAAGKAVTGVVSTQVAAWAEGVMRTMFLTKLKIGVLFLLGLTVLAVTTGLVTPRSPDEKPAQTGQEDRTAPPAAARTPADLALVPNDAMGFVRVSARALWNSEAMKKVRRQASREALGLLSEAEKSLGIAIDDIDTVTAIVVPPPGPPLLVVISTARPYAREKVRQALVPQGREQQYKDKTYFSADKDSTALYFVSDRMFMVTELGALQKYFNLVASPGARRPLGEALKLAEHKYDVVAGLHIPEGLAQMIRQEEVPPAAAFLMPLLDVELGTLTMNFDSEAKTRLTLRLPDEAAAEKAVNAIETGVGVLKQQLAAVQEEARKDAFLAALVKEATELLRTVSLTRQKATIKVTLEGDSASLLGMVLPAVQKTRTAARRMQSTNNLKQIALAMHNYADAYGHFPPAAIRATDGTPLLSWRVAILPFIEGDALYKQFHLDEPWDSEHNKKLLEKMPLTYAPTNVATKEPYTTFYQVFTGQDTVFEDPQGNKFQDVTDGLSNTLLAVEAGKAVPWTKPEDLRYDPKKPLPKLGGQFPEGFVAAFCDGSCRFISKEVDEKLLRALITRNGGEAVDLGKIP
jgi:RNA polymerase sigma factor (sigma-70 family)